MFACHDVIAAICSPSVRFPGAALCHFASLGWFFGGQHRGGDQNRDFEVVVTGTIEFYDFPKSIGNFIIPTDELHELTNSMIFQRLKPLISK